MSARPAHFVIPELCNTTALALLVLFSQLLVVVLLFAGDEISWMRFGLMSLFVQWIALMSAAVLCSLRRFLTYMSLAWGATLTFSVVLVVTAVIAVCAELIIDRGPGAPFRVLSDLIIAGIITGLVSRYFYVQQRLRQQEQAELHSRIQALQSRIRPHFLFNSMNIIASLIESDPETAERVVEDLSELFRASLNEVGNQVPIADELDLCERYIRIEGLRLGNRLELDWQIEQSDAGVQIPLLTLQPLLENAIYHGIQPLPEGGVVQLKVTYPADEVSIVITNPVPETSGDNVSEGNRMALQNIRSRLSVLYGDRASLKTLTENNQFVTELRFPSRPQTVT